MWKKTTSLFSKKKGSSSSKPSSTTSSRRHSVFESHRSMETHMAPLRRNDALLLGGMRAARSTSMRFTEPQGHTEEQPAPPRRLTRSTAPRPYTPIYSSYGFIILSAPTSWKNSKPHGQDTFGRRRSRNGSGGDPSTHVGARQPISFGRPAFGGDRCRAERPGGRAHCFGNVRCQPRGARGFGARHRSPPKDPGPRCWQVRAGSS
jgi:hypothetical protein